MEFESEVGTIVWVRRRNGSWWPGKILGGEELSASHLMSPRSGTPVKLLGREDASVDWYNLEKSKRVKPFRCGEFDDCISRAQASQGMPPKKREKYARREDAILHALELEKQFLHKKYPNLQTPLPLNSKPSSVNNNNPPPPYHPNADDDDDNDDLSPHDTTIKRKRPRHDDDNNDKEEQESTNKRRLNTSPKLPPNPMPLQTHPPLLLEEEDNKTPIAEPPEMAAAAAASGDSSDHTPDHLLQGEKRKPSPEEQSMQLDHKEHPKSDESFDYNQTPLSDWVDVSTPKSQNAFTYGLSEENNTTEEDDDDDEDDEEEDEDDEDEEEDTETDSSGTESLSSDTYDATLSDDADQIEFIPKVFGRSETGEDDESMSDADESDESLPTSVTVSKWQLKGKRNTRSLMKRYRNAAGDNKLLVGSSQWMNYRGGEDRLAADSFDKRLRSQAIGFNMPTRDVGLDSSHDIINSVEGYWEQQPTDYHDSSLAYMSSLQFGGRMKPMLIDVDVQVQSGYQREHVPMISLMSKLNDKAIVGHPIPVETIQDGSSDIILSAAETYEYQTESLVLDPDDTALQPWRTARRTAKCRVPRPPAQDEYAAADEERKHNNRKGGSISRKWPSPKLQKKPQRRSVLSHSQKIRTLSSIGGGGDQISDLRAEDGVMKPAAAAVACIPVKLVFSRLHEELVARHQ